MTTEIRQDQHSTHVLVGVRVVTLVLRGRRLIILQGIYDKSRAEFTAPLGIHGSPYLIYPTIIDMSHHHFILCRVLTIPYNTYTSR